MLAILGLWRDKFRQAKKSRQAFAGMERKKRGREVATSLLVVGAG
jgi:hypothetical protein